MPMHQKQQEERQVNVPCLSNSRDLPKTASFWTRGEVLRHVCLPTEHSAKHHRLESHEAKPGFAHLSVSSKRVRSSASQFCDKEYVITKWVDAGETIDFEKQPFRSASSSIFLSFLSFGQASEQSAP